MIAVHPKRAVCQSMTQCIAKGRGCPMYSRWIVSVLMACLLYVVMEYATEQLVKHHFDTFGDVMVVMVDDEVMHEYETKLWVKGMNLIVAVATLFLTYTHLSQRAVFEY